MSTTPDRPARPETTAFARALAEFGRHLYRGPGPVVEAGAGRVLAVTLAPAPDLNLVYGAAPDDPGSTLARLRAWRVPFLWLVPPGDEALGAALEAAGAPLVAQIPVMTLDLAGADLGAAPVPGLEVRRVSTEADLRAWAGVAAGAFHFDEASAAALLAAGRDAALDPDSPAHLSLGVLDGEPVGTALHVMGDADVGVWCVGVAERARRRGVGAAMTTSPLPAARAAGYRSAILGATEMGLPVYRRLGWEERFACPVHAVLSWEAAAAPAPSPS
jgi:GNAT superfamily N-acetyltransferase